MNKHMTDLTAETITGGVHSSPRHDSAHKHVAGTAVYIDDITEPAGTLHAGLGLSTVAHGILKHVDLDAVRAAPGVVDGEHWDGVDALFAKYENRPLGEKKKLVGEGVPYGRMGRAEDLTGMAVFLASAEADYIVAQTYNVDGGQWMS